MTTEREQVEAQIKSEVAQQGRDGEARRAERTQVNNAVRRALNERDAQENAAKQQRQQRIDSARASTKERIGVTSHLPGHAHMQRTTLAVQHAVDTVGKALDAIATMCASPMFTPAQLVLGTADRANATIEAASKELGEARAVLLTVQNTTAERTIKAYTPPSHLTQQVAEARAVLRTMPTEQRYDLIAKARGDDAEVLMYAVGGVPAFLSGVAEGKRVEMRRMLLGVRDPELLTLEQAIPDALATLDKAEAGVRSLFEEVVDFKAAKALRGEV